MPLPRSLARTAVIRIAGLAAATLLAGALPAGAQPPERQGSAAAAAAPPVPRALCAACEPARREAERAIDEYGRSVGELEYWQGIYGYLQEVDAGREPNAPKNYNFDYYRRLSGTEKYQAKAQLHEIINNWITTVLGDRERVDEALAKLEACNRTCGSGVTIGGVIGVTGTNPFDPDNPTGTPTGPQQPPPAGDPGQVQFSSASFGGTEGATVTVTVTRTHGASGAASIQYVASDRTANAGADFVATQGTLSWAHGDTSAKSFTVQLIDDSAVEPTEHVELTLLNPVGARMAEPSRATIAINDNDSAAPPRVGSLQFSTSGYAAAEGQGPVTITVTRTGGSDGAVSVRYATGQNSAIAGADYQSASGTLSWAAGDTSPRTFTVGIIDDTAFEGTEAFSVTLSNPTGGATLGTPSTATVSIADNDAQTGACGPAGNTWLQVAGTFSCFGNCDPCPTPQRLSVQGNRVTISPFHGGGAATFTGCASPLQSDSSSLLYFGQANHRATLTRTGNNYRADIQSSGGGSCVLTCLRTGP